MDNTDNTKPKFLSMAITKEGIEYDPNEDIWKIKDPFSSRIFHFNKLPIAPEYLYGLKRIFIYYIENNALGNSTSIFYTLKALLDQIHSQTGHPVNTITEIDLENFKTSLGKSREHKLGSTAAFLKKWYKMGFGVITDKAYRYLLETSFKGNPKGIRILTRDPIKGPFSILESESIVIALKNALADGNIENEEYLLIRLLHIYGQRIVTYAHLKICDIKSNNLQNGTIETVISLPLAKKRGGKFREHFLERPVPKNIATILKKHANSISKAFENILEDTNQAPLFPDFENISNKKNAYHCMPKKLGRRVTSIIDKLQIISERTGKLLHANPQRFRDTLATRMAEEGHGAYVIAEALGHEDTQHVGVYIDALTDHIAEKLNENLALYFAPIAQAFAGDLVMRNDDLPGMDILYPKASNKSMGKCGTNSFCGLISPIACYTCSSFTAWDDGPHRKILHHLLEKREELLQKGGERMAAIHDKTIYAVAQVVMECEIRQDPDFDPDITLLTK